ncbi:MAG: phosphotransferase [Actinomycetota bacterium]
MDDREPPPPPDADEAEVLDAVRRAAPWWGLDPVSVSVLSVSENVVCALTEPDGRRVVVRLHRPGYNTIEQLRSEVAWVDALRAEGVPVPTPVATPDGDHYRPVEMTGGRRYVGVVEWVEGAPLGGPVSSGSAGVVAHFGRIGEIAAAVRAGHARWTAPPGFTRRRWDADGLVGEEPLWGRFWEADGLDPSGRRQLGEARSVLHRELSALPVGPEHFGLIHADLHLGNVMADGERLTAIDFDDSGYGFWPYEVAVALHPVLDEPFYPEAREGLLAGYRRRHPFEPEEERLVDTFLAVRCSIIVGWLAARPELPMHDRFDELAGAALEVTGRYLRDGHL